MAALPFRDESGMEVTKPLISCESINPRPFQNVNPGPRTPSGEGPEASAGIAIAPEQTSELGRGLLAPDRVADGIGQGIDSVRKISL